MREKIRSYPVIMACLAVIIGFWSALFTGNPLFLIQHLNFFGFNSGNSVTGYSVYDGLTPNPLNVDILSELTAFAISPIGIGMIIGTIVAAFVAKSSMKWEQGKVSDEQQSNGKEISGKTENQTL